MDEGRAPLFGEHSTYLIVTLFLFHPYLGQKICTKYFTVDFLPNWLAFLREYLCSSQIRILCISWKSFPSDNMKNLDMHMLNMWFYVFSWWPDTVFIVLNVSFLASRKINSVLNLQDS